MIAEDEKILKEHIDRHTNRGGVGWTCPCCGTNAWAMSGPYVTNKCSRDKGLNVAVQITNEGAPFVAIVCSGCFLAMFFAWKPILEAAEKESKENP